MLRAGTSRSWLGANVRGFADGSRGFGLRCGNLSPRAQSFPNGPCLCDATLRRERWIAVKNFARCAEAGGRDMLQHRFEKRCSNRRILMDVQVRQRERAQQPAPDCPLMIGGIAFFRLTRIPPAVARLARPQTPQSERSQEFTRAYIDNRLLLRRC